MTEPTPTPEQRVRADALAEAIVSPLVLDDGSFAEIEPADLERDISDALVAAEQRGAERERERLADVWERALLQLPKALAALIEEEEKKR